MHHLIEAAWAMTAALSHAAATTPAAPTAGVGVPTNAPPGLFLRIFIVGGFAFVVFCAWFVLRGYRNSGDGKS